MLRNYIKVAIRNIKRNKLYASLNILGLSIGLGSFFIIYLFLQNELAYDQFHAKKDRIYRVIENVEMDSGIEHNGGLTSALAPVAAEEIPEIEAFSRVENYPRGIVVEGIKDSVDNVNSLAVDVGIVDLFSFDFIYGSQETSFKTPHSLLLSESKALLYFGTADAMGKVVKVRGEAYMVDGVFKDFPITNSYKADIVVPLTTVDAYRGDAFTTWNLSYFDQTLFLLNDQASVEEVEKKINDVYAANALHEGKQLTLQPITDVHFSLGVNDSVSEKTDRQYIFIFTIVAVFILACSIFNYISLALAQSIERTKEIGVRKVIGAKHKELYKQFISESFIQVLSGFVLSVILVELLMPSLETLIDRELGANLIKEPILIVQGLLFSLVLSVLCSLYPAYVSARLNVVSIFRKSYGSFSPKRLIGAVSVFQITVFVVLICVAFTANRQLKFMQNENLGFDKDQQFVLSGFPETLQKKIGVLKNELAELPTVSNTTFASSIPGRVSGSMKMNNYDFRFFNFRVDKDYFETMGMELVEGRPFLPEDSDTSNLVIVNETGAKKLGFEDTAVGKIINNGSKELRIIGVVKDFHFVSKKEPVEATLFQPFDLNSSYGIMVVKIDGQNLTAGVDQIKSTFTNLSDGVEPRFFFLEDQINAQYKQENIMITMINTFVIIAALVAFIGLFGIAGYSVKRRMKEMGIRKVLGAGFMTIQRTLNRSSFYKLLMAIVIAVPIVIAWMDNWLSTFAYRIEMPVFLIFAAILLASLVIFLTISIHSIKAYRINPVEILKDE